MAEYNPSKIIKDGNTYNFRDTTKIPLSGSNQISGSLIPSTDGTVNLGSLSYQWDQAYIKSLIINGVACGDILTHNAAEFASKATTLSGYGITDAYTKTQVDKKVSDLVNSAPETLDTLNELASALGNDPNFATTVANQIGTKANDSEVVKLSGNQTIAGIKSFSNDIRISKASPFCNVFSSGYIKGQAPTSNIYSGVRFFDDINSGSTNTITGGFEVEYNRDGYNKSYIASRNYAGENHKFFTVGLRVPNDDTRSVDFLPSVSNQINLGTSTNKWANVYATTFNGNVTGEGALTLQSSSGTSRIYIRNNNASNYPSSVNLYSKIGDGPEYGVFLNGDMFHPNINDAMSLGSNNYKWAKVYSDDVVHTTDNETISGIKTFSDGLFVSKSGQGDLATLEDSSINSTNEDANGMPLTGHSNSVKIKGSQFNVVPCMLTGQLFTSGDTSAELRAYKYKDLTTNATIALRYVYANNSGFVQLKNISFIIPNVTNTANLGSSSLQWNTTYTRNILIDNDINIASSLINKTSNSGVLTVRGGINDSEGASLSLYGKDYGGSPGLIGNIYMTAYGNSDYTNFRIYPNGIIRVYNNSTATTKNVAMQEDVIPRSGGAVLTNYFLGRSENTGSLMINGGTSWSSGGSLETFGSSHSSYAGQVRLQPALSDANFKTMNLEPSGTWSWSGTACQITSDQRYKQQITEIDDKLLDAWEDVELSQFKYNDAVNEKGNNARLHTGYVVQQIDEACKSHGVDISAYGLYCHEEYPEETKEVEIEQEDGTKVKERKVIREASEHYSLRYTEALIVECKYLRRCIARLTARIEELEKGSNSK